MVESDELRDIIDGGYPSGGNMTKSHIETLETLYSLPQEEALTRQIKEQTSQTSVKGQRCLHSFP